MHMTPAQEICEQREPTLAGQAASVRYQHRMSTLPQKRSEDTSCSVHNGRESSPQPRPLECYTTRRMPTRLQKLVALLANGPSEAARLAAARQLGELQRAHPAQLHVLLQHILRHLFAPEWSTRRAAAAALQAVAEAADAWSPEQPEEPDEAAEEAARADAEGAWLSFRSFEMASVLAHGRPVLASGEVPRKYLGSV